MEPGTIFAAYLVGYGFVRFWVEGLRVDPAHEFGGLRLNQWVFLVVFLLAGAFLIRALRRMTPPEPPEQPPAVRGERPGARGTERGRRARAGPAQLGTASARRPAGRVTVAARDASTSPACYGRPSSHRRAASPST